MENLLKHSAPPTTNLLTNKARSELEECSIMCIHSQQHSYQQDVDFEFAKL